MGEYNQNIKANLSICDNQKMKLIHWFNGMSLYICLLIRMQGVIQFR